MMCSNDELARQIAALGAHIDEKFEKAERDRDELKANIRANADRLRAMENWQMQIKGGRLALMGLLAIAATISGSALAWLKFFKA